MGGALDILIVAYRVQEDLAEALSGISRWTRPGYRLTVYDNETRNYPLSWLWNRFIEQSGRDFIALVNPDVLVGPDWDAECVACLETHPECSVASPFTNHEAIRYNYPAVVPDLVRSGEVEGLTAKLREVFQGRRFILSQDKSLTPAHCSVIRKDAWRRVGGFDEKIPFTGNDYDFNRRTIQAGYRVGLCTHAMSFHKWHKSVEAAVKAGTYDENRKKPLFGEPPPGANWRTL